MDPTSSAAAPPADPRLLLPLRIAIGSLFSEPASATTTTTTTTAAAAAAAAAAYPELQHSALAHTFLIELQSRNVRRNILSLQQRFRDQTAAATTTTKTTTRRRRSPGEDDTGDTTTTTMAAGSSWFACFALLSYLHEGVWAASYAERLFAAQSLLHRVRRTKIIEAIDLELERDDLEKKTALEMYQPHPSPDAVAAAALNTLLAWLPTRNPFVYLVLSTYGRAQQQSTTTWSTTGGNQADYEEKIKGESMLLALAAVLYISACDPEAVAKHRPLLEAVGSAMAAIALRVRYSRGSSSTGSDGQPHQQHPSLVVLLTDMFATLWNSAASVHPNATAVTHALRIALGAIPDTVFGNPGGARGRLSIDPVALEGAVNDLRHTGWADLWRALEHFSNPQDDSAESLLDTLEKWAQFLVIPLELVDHSRGFVESCLTTDNPNIRRHALRYLLAIFQGGSWTMEQVVSFSVGLSDKQNLHQTGRRKQSSASKKRHKEILSNRVSHSGVELAAQQEIALRGAVACRVVANVWNQTNPHFHHELTRPTDLDGEGAIVCIASAIQACLPFLLRTAGQPVVDGPQQNPHEAAAVFQCLSEALVLMTASPNRAVRALTFEPVYAINTAMLTSSVSPVQEQTVGLLVKCLLNLGASCMYPLDYFLYPMAESDLDLEVYRNDVRDAIRALAGGEIDDSHHTTKATAPSVPDSHRFLVTFTTAVRDDLITAQAEGRPLTETQVHAFSAMAKPLNRAAKELVHSGNIKLQGPLVHGVGFLTACLGEVVTAMRTQSIAPHDLLPLCRTMNIAVASISPMLAFLSSSSQFHGAVVECIKLGVQVVMLSIRSLPELAGKLQDDSPREIRGTMRGPGGEDHVGCLALMRMTSENSQFTAIVMECSTPFIEELCGIYTELKRMEGRPGGPVTTPKSRRIFLGVLCRLQVSSGGRGPVAVFLERLFQDCLRIIHACPRSCNEEVMLALTEAALDIGHFDPSFVRALFDINQYNRECVEKLASVVADGYNLDFPTELAVHQWNRLRAALYGILVDTACPDFTESAATLIHRLIHAECIGVQKIFALGKSGNSASCPVDLVFPEELQAGMFIMTVGKQFLRVSKQRAVNSMELPWCLHVLKCSQQVVCETILSPKIQPRDWSIDDPRSYIAEAWFTTVGAMVSAFLNTPTLQDLNTLVSGSVVAGMMLIFTPDTKTQTEPGADNGMSMDGPQSLVLIEFITVSLSGNEDSVRGITDEVVRNFPFACDPGVPSLVAGLSIVVSALFRAFQGALPPWVIESAPALFAHIFRIVGNNGQALCHILNMAMNLRRPAHDALPSNLLRGLRPGQLLAGPIFETVSTPSRESFLSNSLENASSGNWKRFKHSVKNVCGGKKKDTDFRQKPALSRWEFGRV